MGAIVNTTVLALRVGTSDVDKSISNQAHYVMVGATLISSTLNSSVGSRILLIEGEDCRSFVIIICLSGQSVIRGL